MCKCDKSYYVYNIAKFLNMIIIMVNINIIINVTNDMVTMCDLYMGNDFVNIT